MGKGNRNKTKRKLGADASAEGSKKGKVDDVLSVISPSLLSEKSRNKLKWFHDHSGPYKHLVLSPLCHREHMVKVHEEIVQNLDGNLKETDLYKLYQTTEMSRIKAGVGDNSAILGHLLQLREAIYSKDFRDFIQDITGCGELTDRTDLSCNAYSNGCHLLCHDDVIGTRCISFIMYITDPNTEWTATDGGGLELYPLDETAPQTNGQGIPTSIPTKTILPKFNTMALFVVQPGKSYHSVQEVFTSDKPRISVSGWYHTKEPPVGSDLASLNQILKKGDDMRMYTPITPYKSEVSEKKDKKDKKEKKEKKGKKSISAEEGGCATSAALTANTSAVDYLKCFINPIYLDPKSLDDINRQFVVNSSIQLGDFLADYIADRIKELAKAQDSHDKLGNCQVPTAYDIGVKEVCSSSTASESSGKDAKKSKGAAITGTDWVLTGPPHKRRYLNYPVDDEGIESSNMLGLGISEAKVRSYVAAVQSLGELLSYVNKHVFQCNIFTSFMLPLITELDSISGYRNEVRRFRPGLDYTVAHFGLMTSAPKLDCTLCFAYDSEDEEEEEEEEDQMSDEPDSSSNEREDSDSDSDSNGNDDQMDADSGFDSESEEDEEEDEEEEGQDEFVSEEDRSWEGGDVGGFECYIAADDDAENVEASEVYQIQSTDASSGGADVSIDKDGSYSTAQKKSAKNSSGEANESELLSISAASNVLSIVMRDEKVMKFVKYVNSHAPSSRWDITAEYEL